MKWIKRLCSFIFLCLFLVVAFMLWRGYGDCQDALKKMSVQQMGAQIQAKEDYTTLDQLPKDYIDAVLAVEDKRFYKHPGIDPLAKNQFFTQDKKISRKVAEMFMAFEIEKVYDKDTILELYLNSIYFGNGYNSVAEACRGYFGKEPMEMNFDECTMLAGIPNAPSAYNPLVNPDLAYQRQQQVIRKMEKAGFLNK